MLLLLSPNPPALQGPRLQGHCPPAHRKPHEGPHQHGCCHCRSCSSALLPQLCLLRSTDSRGGTCCSCCWWYPHSQHRCRRHTSRADATAGAAAPHACMDPHHPPLLPATAALSAVQHRQQQTHLPKPTLLPIVASPATSPTRAPAAGLMPVQVLLRADTWSPPDTPRATLNSCSGCCTAPTAGPALPATAAAGGPAATSSAGATPAGLLP